MKFALVLAPPNNDEHLQLAGYSIRHVVGPFDETVSNDEIVDMCRKVQGGNHPTFTALIVEGTLIDSDC